MFRLTCIFNSREHIEEVHKTAASEDIILKDVTLYQWAK